jgi:hypothetical protein
VHLSWAAREDDALAIAFDQWRSNVFRPPVCWDLETPAHFDEVSRHVRPDDVRGSVLVGSDLSWHLDQLHEMVSLGFDGVFLHHVGRQQDEFIDTFAEHVVPALRARP